MKHSNYQQEGAQAAHHPHFSSTPARAGEGEEEEM